jgi:hypothetical protein
MTSEENEAMCMWVWRAQGESRYKECDLKWVLTDGGEAEADEGCCSGQSFWILEETWKS